MMQTIMKHKPPLKAGKDKDMDSPENLQEETDQLTLDFSPLFYFEFITNRTV